MTEVDPSTIIGEADAPNLALDVLPDNVPGTFLLDVSELDGLDRLGWGAEGWANVVCDVTSVRSTRGATRLQGALTRAEAGNLTITLRDTERRFDPTINADAIHPGVMVRLRVWGTVPNGTDTDGTPLEQPWTAVLFTGRIGGDYAVAYQQAGPPVVTFTAVDVIGPLSQYRSVGRADPGIGAGDDLLERVARVVDEVGLPPETVSANVDTGYVATMPASNLTAGWDDIGAAVDAELGRVWVSATDQLVVRSRGSELSGPVRGTLSDWHGETADGDETGVHCCYTDPVVRFGTDQLVNRAIGARRVPRPAGGGAVPTSSIVQVDDEYSQTRWTNGTPVTHEDRSLELDTDAQLRPWAESLVLAASEPELRVDEVTARPSGAGPEAWRAVCETDIGDRWFYRQHPEVGETILETLGVLGIAHNITPEGWTVTFTTVKAPTPGEGNPRGWFMLGDASTDYASELDSGDVLAPFGGIGL